MQQQSAATDQIERNSRELFDLVRDLIHPKRRDSIDHDLHSHRRQNVTATVWTSGGGVSTSAF